MFGYIAKEWQKANPERHNSGENLRDSASINELNVLKSNASLFTRNITLAGRLPLYFTSIAQNLALNWHLSTNTKLIAFF